MKVRVTHLEKMFLNVRQGPSLDSILIGSVREGSIAIVDESKSANGFYYVTFTEPWNHICGYCMKEYFEELKEN